MNAEPLLKVASFSYIGLLAAGLLMPRVTGLWTEARKMGPFAQGLFHTYYLFIGLCLVGFGVGSWVYAAELGAGTPLFRQAAAGVGQ